VSYAAYWQIRDLLPDLKPFEGNSMSAHVHDNGLYSVYSYNTCIALYDPSDDTLYENTTRYSVTTAHHQSALWPLAQKANYHVEVETGMRGFGAWLRLMDVRSALMPATA
jgi:hypothetical protein